ncbi:hypothetical protein [Microbacterium marinilacus]|uniref:Uncharacterized protein n=1 Tax=Microbacterium marinilacus TaxID=415209 RepID=A0ABP7B541_9MICO|nr:hypothetical protein [Microbacterium marinilacus]MBY0687941.1 hypothetical protein [Microbacterium marinilacus]
MPDLLDQLLDRSAPPAPRRIDTTKVRAMVRDARAQSRPRRRVRAAALSGVLAGLLLGGAGAATAASVWDWGPDMGDPDRSYAYTSPTWGECELRFGGFAAFSVFEQGEVDRIIDDWFARTDLDAEVEPLVPGYLDGLQRDQAGDPDMAADPRLPDLNAWTAREQAVLELLDRELRANGYDGTLGTGVAESASQLHCEDEQWG